MELGLTPIYDSNGAHSSSLYDSNEVWTQWNSPQPFSMVVMEFDLTFIYDSNRALK